MPMAQPTASQLLVIESEDIPGLEIRVKLAKAESTGKLTISIDPVLNEGPNAVFDLATPKILDRLEEAVLVGERRWTLRLAGGPDILLPAGREAEALADLMAGQAALRILDGSAALIDARPADRLVIRPRRETASRSADPSG